MRVDHAAPVGRRKTIGSQKNAGVPDARAPPQTRPRSAIEAVRLFSRRGGRALNIHERQRLLQNPPEHEARLGRLDVAHGLLCAGIPPRHSTARPLDHLVDERPSASACRGTCPRRPTWCSGRPPPIPVSRLRHDALGVLMIPIPPRSKPLSIDTSRPSRRPVVMTAAVSSKGIPASDRVLVITGYSGLNSASCDDPYPGEGPKNTAAEAGERAMPGRLQCSGQASGCHGDLSRVIAGCLDAVRTHVGVAQSERMGADG